MEVDLKSIKQKAREDLDGKWKIAILSVAISNILSLITGFFLEYEGLLYNIMVLVYDGIFLFGYTAVMLNISRKNDVDLSVLFDGCKNFLKGIGIRLLLNIYIMLWSILLVIPGIMASISYSMACYIWVDNPDIGINEAITRSKELTNGHKMEIFKLYLTFIGWVILISIPAIALRIAGFDYMVEIMTLGMIFLNPYIDVSVANIYNNLTKETKNNIMQ